MGSPLYILDSYGWTGVIAISGNWIPGTEGSLSSELYESLLNRGWQSCIYWNEEEPLPDYLSYVKDYLDDEEIEFPTTLLVKGTYDSDRYENLLDQYGVDRVICYPAGSVSSLNTRWTDEARQLFYYCDWTERSLDSYISLSRKQGGAFYTICYTNDADRDDHELCLNQAEHFFEYIYKIENNDGKCIVGSMEKYELLKEREADGSFLTEKDMQYFESRIAELQQKIEEINEKRESLIRREENGI